MVAIIDYRGKTPEKTISGIPLITAKVIKNGGITAIEEYIAPEEYDSWMRRGLPEVGDVVMTTEAPLGEVAQLDSSKVALGQRLITLRGKPNILDNTYLKFAMQTLFVQDQLRARATGTTVLGIRQSELRTILLPIPSLSEQREIARILGALDDKIEANRRMNATLEATAQALFRSWFVDFDPVRAKAAGRAPEGMDAATAALFPDGLEASALGDVPQGWRAGALGEIATNPRRTVQPDEIAPGTVYIGLEHMPRKSITLAEWGNSAEVTSNKFAFHRGEILFGKLRPYFHKVGVALTDGVCSTDIVVVSPSQRSWYGVTLGHVASEDFVSYATARSDGTKMPRTHWHDMAQYPIVIPPISLADVFTRQIEPLIDSIRVRSLENSTLADLRDTLLPRLLSGELRVGEAATIAEAAGV